MSGPNSVGAPGSGLSNIYSKNPSTKYIFKETNVFLKVCHHHRIQDLVQATVLLLHQLRDQ